MHSIYSMRPLSSLLIICWVVFMIPLTTAVDQTYGQVEPICNNTGPLVEKSFSAFYDQLSNTSKPVVLECGYRYMVEGERNYIFQGGLEVQGELIFEDGPPSSSVVVQAAYILVQGKLRAGTEEHPFERQLTFVLENFPGSTNLSLENRSGNPRFDGKFNFGTKAFVVLGGTIELYGAEPQGPSHFHLAQSVNEGDKLMYVKGDVSHWKKGDRVVIAPDERSNRLVPRVGVRKVIYMNTLGQSEVHLSRRITQTYAIRTFQFKRPGGALDSFVAAPEVVKINRNIRIFGMPLGTPLGSWFFSGSSNITLGGHFIISNSAGKQVIQGVEFAGMGQAGLVGRYPLHFHFGGDVHRDSHFSYNSIHHSQQRCLVVHATNNLKVKYNVAFRTRGHCFMTEDGMEVGNLFEGNIGVGIRGAIKLINENQSDHRAAVFWMASPTNDLIGNVAAGSNSSGFWYEGFTSLQGLSRDTLPGGDSFVPNRADVGIFLNNEAHSCISGLKTYPLPIRPPLDNPANLQNFIAWSIDRGFQLKIGSNQKLSNATILDVFKRGIDFRRQHGVVIEDTVIVGTEFDKPDCRGEKVGIYLEGEFNYSLWSSGLGPTTIRNVHVENFKKNPDCSSKPVLGTRIEFNQGDKWLPSATSFEKVTYSDVDVKLRVDVAEEQITLHQQIAFQVSNASVDSVAPDKVGYVVSDSFGEGEDILKEGCDDRAQSLSKDIKFLFCENQCWRHVSFAYKRDKSLKATHVRFTFGDDGLKSFDVTAGQRNVFKGTYNRVVSKLLPSGTYHVTLLDKEKIPISTDLYNATTFYVSFTDELRGRPACDEKVVLTVGDDRTELQQSPLMAMDGEVDAVEVETD